MNERFGRMGVTSRGAQERLEWMSVTSGGPQERLEWMSVTSGGTNDCLVWVSGEERDWIDGVVWHPLNECWCVWMVGMAVCLWWLSVARRGAAGECGVAWRGVAG